MRYGLGVDLGTTFTGAAIGRLGHTEMLPLGERSTVAPAVVFARSTGELVSGDPAVRRAVEDPERAAREFKRRLGDPTPMILGGTPYSPARLMAACLHQAVSKASEVFGNPPERIVLTHPAVWGPYRREQFAEVPRLAGLDDIVTVAEPVAAATFYTATRDLAEGEVIAVYDLGGGTFDLTVVVAREGTMRILGHPEGVEWLGGIDFDEAVVAYVDRQLGGAVGALDPYDREQASALFRLRQECVLAKEALSVEDEVTIPVWLPDKRADVPLSRVEFEGMIQPALDSTVEALFRGLESAGVRADDVSAVLLVGGSSRIPLVSRMVKAAIQRPTVVNAHPKHSVALGAALIAARQPEQVRRASAAEPATPTMPTMPTTPSAPPASAPAPVREAGPDAETAVAGTGSEDAGGPDRPGGTVPAGRNGSPAPAARPGTRAARRRRRRPVAITLFAVLVLVLAAIAGTLYGRAHRADGSPLPGSTTSPSAISSTYQLAPHATLSTQGQRPQGVVFTPDGKRAYVPNVVSDTVSVMATAADRQVEEITTAGPPQYLAMAPDGSKVYVTLDRPKAKANSVVTIDTATDRVVGTVAVDPAPNPPAVSPDGRLLYVPDQQTSRITVIDTTAGTVAGHIAIAGVPGAVAFAPDGQRAYVSDFNLEQVSVVDVASSRVLTTVRVGVTPTAVAVSPDGGEAAVANYDSHSVSLIDTAQEKVTHTAQVGAHPQALAYAPDGQTLYAVNDGAGTLSVIRTGDGTVRQTVKVGQEPWAVAVSPDGRLVYVTNASDNTVSVFGPAAA